MITMSESAEPIKVESVVLGDVAGALQHTRIFADTPLDSIRGIERADRITAKAETVLIEAGAPWFGYWLLIEGAIRADRPEKDGTWSLVSTARSGEGIGEVPLLIGRSTAAFRVTTTEDSILLRFSDQDFWDLLACCPSFRKTVLADSAQRMQAYQEEALHREKLASLGTMAAGLMHELHNPGSAAKRAASQLRENLLRLQELSLRSAEKPKSPKQLKCMKDLLEHALHGCNLPAMSSLEQADAEEAMSEWLAHARVENAYTIGPVLVGMGCDREEISCAQEFFDPASFSDALNWFGALVSSVSLVCAIEESIARISELVMAVKKFAYDEKTPSRELDIHDSLQSTLTILGHKLRVKQIQIDKKFTASPSIICTRGYALSQVWTNLIDNAIDASPQNSRIEIETSSEPEWLTVQITDHGAGIPSDVLPRIFEAFFTTKPVGVGTGLGLEIVHRIVTQKFGGSIDVQSQPGQTRFIVRLPVNPPKSSPQQPAKA